MRPNAFSIIYLEYKTRFKNNLNNNNSISNTIKSHCFKFFFKFYILLKKLYCFTENLQYKYYNNLSANRRSQHHFF